MLYNGFFPDKRILVRAGFDLCPINKYGLAGDLSEIMKNRCHVRQKRLGTGRQMKQNEPCDRGVIRSRHPFKKEHKVNVLSAGCFNVAAGKQPVHGSIDHDLEHLTRSCLIFPNSVIGSIKFRKIHSLHKCTQKADRVISQDHVFHFQWKFDLIISSIYRIIWL